VVVNNRLLREKFGAGKLRSATLDWVVLGTWGTGSLALAIGALEVLHVDSQAVPDVIEHHASMIVNVSWYLGPGHRLLMSISDAVR
jgi:hypothetical protein